MEKLKIDIDKIVNKLDIVTKEAVTSNIIGGYKSVFRGRGLEFDSYKKYNRDEDSKDIDWKASLRAGELLVKQYIEERNLEIFFLVDISSSMVYGTTSKLKSEYAAEVVASLSYVILKSGDTAGLALFSDRIVAKVPPSKHMHQFYMLSKNLSNPYFYGGNFDFESALKFLTTYIKKRAVVIIVSDFIGLDGDWLKYLKIASSKLDIIAVMIRDPADRDLPDNNHPVLVSDPYSDNQLLIVPNKIKKEYSQYTRLQENAIREAFLNSHCDFVKLVTDKQFAGYLIRFFQERKKRLGV
ncbi:MAG: DUF58 domain-containing protein [Nanoarchaeota archaeon]